MFLMQGEPKDEDSLVSTANSSREVLDAQDQDIFINILNAAMRDPLDFRQGDVEH